MQVGKRAAGRPKTIWRRTVEAERRKAGWRDWSTARAVVKDREAWKENVTPWDDDDDDTMMTSFTTNDC